MDHFSPATLEFLDKLQDHNNREWFEQHKSDYRKLVEAPAERFHQDAREALGKLAGQAIDGKTYRIYRDVRFSKDKTPYHPYVRMSFYPAGVAQDTACAYHLSLEPGQLIVGGGRFQFDKPTLDRYRDAVGGPAGARLEKLLEDLRRNHDLDLHEPALKRVPHGYNKDQPRAGLLRHKGISVWNHDARVKERLDDTLLTTVIARFETMQPLIRWLNAL